MRILAAILLFFAVGQADASFSRALDKTELNAINWILQCPVELAEVRQEAQWVGSGQYWNSRNGNEGMTFRFRRRSGFTQTEYVKTLSITRVMRQNPPMDAPAFTVKCELMDEGLE